MGLRRHSHRGRPARVLELRQPGAGRPFGRHSVGSRPMGGKTRSAGSDVVEDTFVDSPTSDRVLRSHDPARGVDAMSQCGRSKSGS